MNKYFLTMRKVRGLVKEITARGGVTTFNSASANFVALEAFSNS